MLMNSKIMAFEEYLKSGRKPNPYFYFINNNNQVLYYLGCSHCFDPSNSIFNIIRHYWSDFLDKTQGKSALALNEGGKRQIYDTEEKSILMDGEAGLLTFLANNKKINCISPEPSPEHETQTLLKDFTKEEVITYYFIRQVAQWGRLIEKPVFTNYIEGSLDSYKSTLDWKDVDFSIKARVNTFNKFTGQTFDHNNYEVNNKFSDPTKSDNVLNLISRRSNIIRDEHIVKAIEENWGVGKSMFIVYGRTHAVMQEPAIKSFNKIASPAKRDRNDGI